MGEITTLTAEQELIFGKIAGSTFLTDTFYFSGGTALSEVYLKHRESVDLDFFSEKRFNSQALFSTLSEWGKELGFTLQPQRVEDTYIYLMSFPSGEKLKVDFAYYPYKRLEPGTMYKGVSVDSLFDIAVNKLLLMNQRTEVKDFVDLYFLLEKFTIWDLIEGVKVKFRAERDPLTLAADFLAVEEFDYLPRMLKPLTLGKLKQFFKNRAKKLGADVVA